jgi:MoaA/NifB/PqqE/SkfB family radical SAM enzyme
MFAAMHQYFIDLVGGCNLRCPSCPVGNSPEAERPTALMSDDMFDGIMARIREETPATEYVHLYNWTEPLLHPRLPELIGIAWKHGIGSHLSTNLNYSRNLEAMIEAEPMRIRISVSGYTQEKYGRTHEKGEIATVIANMRRLRAAIDKYGVRTKVRVPFHCYVDNVGEDYRLMRNLCRELHFKFEPCWAYLMPIEKNVEYLHGGLGERERKLVDLLAVRPEEAREVSLRRLAPDCTLRSDQTVINCDGSVALCCGVYDAKYTVAGSFLDSNARDRQQTKDAHPFCGTCMKEGLHVTMTYGGVEEWNAIAARRLQLPQVPRELVPLPPRGIRRLVRKIGDALAG